MNLFFGIMIFILGTCVGSFINMAGWRIGRKKNFWEKRSYCDFCGKKLSWSDNIPVLSWLYFRGKSRCCGKKLPLLYPIVEITTGILFLVNFLVGGSILNYLILGLLVFEVSFDYQYLMLPDASAWILVGLAAIKWWLGGGGWSFPISALISAIFIYGLHLIKIKGKEAMGDGDALLALFMGLFLGSPRVIVAFYLAFISGAVLGMWLIYVKKRERLSPIPFGPFLIGGTMVAWGWGEKILQLLNI